ncbi:MAG: copper oxidase [Nitrospirota bacterium]
MIPVTAPLRRAPGVALTLAALFLIALPSLLQAYTCERIITADVVAINQSIPLNRFGAISPDGMIFALKRDVVMSSGGASLRPDKRPRPLVLRMNAGDCLRITFTNLLDGVQGDQPATRAASIHVNGLQLVNSITDDGSNVGTNPSSLVMPGDTAVYTLYAEKEGTHLLYSTGAMTGGEGNSGSLAFGLFGAVNVQPKGAEWYRSQLTRAEIDMAADRDKNGTVDYDEQTADGHPLIDYDAKYPAGYAYKEGQPVIRILNDYNEIVHSDLTAIITGPYRGPFPAGTYKPNPAYPDRDQPFREFTILFHDEIGAVQAFPEFNDPVLGFTLHGIRDMFGINYGAAGLGSMLLANRKGVGPNRNCAECAYEDMSFLSWANGDPAMVVDNPANTGLQATKALYPDDPSNVYHSYIADHTKFRILHAGKEHHIFHLHNHQWLFNPDDDNSTYLDSQAIGPGSSYNLEIAYNGGGNRNQSYADSIFHCHFYPHFASGMWSLWRVHDVFENGTILDADGRPAPKSRALPDGEILAGSPIPGLVPLPGLPMAPMPANVQLVAADITGDGIPDSSQIDLNDDGIPDFRQVQDVTIAKNPGYPFHMPAVAGHEPPEPPLSKLFDGGFPRHVMAAGVQVAVTNRFEITSELHNATAYRLPEAGTHVEKTTIDFHATRFHPTFTPEGAPAQFETNGRPAVRGAPFADPCKLDNGTPVAVNRTYKGAVIDPDVKINKAGWHFPQSHIVALWEDVAPLMSGAKAPEPFIFRTNSEDCIEFHHTNLTAHEEEANAFQIRHNTVMIGQHIHLVKFDVQASNGGSTGYNYEDSSMSPEAVRHHIHAVNETGGIINEDGTRTPLVAQPHPFFKDVPGVDALGAQTTVYRWYADSLLNNQGVDRTLGNVFTHDHMTPSTNQHTGLYGMFIVEPKGSSWRNPETGAFFGTRADGGPTSWRADILTANPRDSFREFVFMFQDFQLAFLKGACVAPGDPSCLDVLKAVNPPGKVEVGLPFLLAPPDVCPGGVEPPCPEAISADDPGTFSVNFRNEPIALRVRDPQTNKQAAGLKGDLAYAFASRTDRADPAFNMQPAFYPPLTADVRPSDPFTPMMRVYENDRVRIRIQVGAQEEGHIFSMHGVKWLQEFASPNSGYRNAQMMGISEQFILDVPINPNRTQLGVATDYLYTTNAAVDGYWNGTWGLMRAYSTLRGDLRPLPSNPVGPLGLNILNIASFPGMCPSTAPLKKFDVTAVTAQNALPGGTLIYNSRTENGGPLNDPTALLYVRTADLDAYGKLKANVPVEPLILRANAGDCIEVTLRNKLPVQLPDPGDPDTWGFSTLPMIVNNFNSNELRPSSHVGLHPQLVAYDVTKSDGANVGINVAQTVAPNGTRTYRWYAGDIKFNSATRLLSAIPAEFGATNLISSDRIKHSNKGAIGALVIEPKGASVIEDYGTRAAATVKKPDGSSFREFVLLFQDDVNLRFGSDAFGFAAGDAVPNTAEAEDPEDSGQKALNYRTEPFWFRLGFAPDTPLMMTREEDFSNVLSNDLIGGDPETPVFTAKKGAPTRFRILQPGGHARNHVFTLHGHTWQRQPYQNNSTVIGDRPLSFLMSAQEGHGPANHFDVVPQHGAGGNFNVKGDYLYRDNASFFLDGGMWGLFRVTE